MVGQLPAGGSGPAAAPSFAAAGDTPLVAGLDVVVVDVETTGFRPGQATIIEIGAVRLSGRQVTGEFFSLVSPAPAWRCPRASPS